MLRQTTQAQGRLLGKAETSGELSDRKASLDTLLQNIVTSSAIENERLNVGSLRSSLAKRLGLTEREVEQGVTRQTRTTTVRSEGLAALMMDATGNIQASLTKERLFQWHHWLFPDQQTPLLGTIKIGALRGDEPMQVVSGRIDRPTVHFEAPPREVLDNELKRFLDWFNSSSKDANLDPLLRAGIAHFWFVTLHPFDDGNGRLARAITDLALAQGEQQSIRLYAMSAVILEHRQGYYDILERSQKGSPDITGWLDWFLSILSETLQTALSRIDAVLDKARFWRCHVQQTLSPEQVLNRLLDGGPQGFEKGINATQYQRVAKVSKATATRHLSDLLNKGCLEKLPGGGRSTRYRITGAPGTEGKQ